MAIQTIPGGLWMPAAPDMSGSGPAFGTATIDAAGEKVAIILRCPKTGTLDKFGWRQNTNPNTPDNGLRFSFQDIDGSGNPDGTQDQFRDLLAGFGAATWLEPGLITSDGTDTGTKRSVTAGDILACVIEFVSFVASDNVGMSQVLMPSDPQEQAFGGIPYGRHNTGAWVAFASGAIGTIALKYNDGSYYYVGTPWYPYLNFNTATYNSGSSPDERGMIFQVPIISQVSGAWARIDLDNNCDLVLYDSDGTTPMVTIAMTNAQRSSVDNVTVFVPFAPQTLAANTNYRLVIKPGASNVSLLDFDVPSAAYLNAVEGGQNWHYTQRTDAGAWTQTTTKRPFMGLLFTGFDSGGGGAGVSVFGS